MSAICLSLKCIDILAAVSFQKILYKIKFSIIGIILDSADERRCYNVTLSLIGWAHFQNDTCIIC